MHSLTHLDSDGNARMVDVGDKPVKRCDELIPLCHGLGLDAAEVSFRPDDREPVLHIEAVCRVHGRTGVEMEALTAVSVAALTVYDMCKAVDRGMVIGDICLQRKEGGRSGSWARAGATGSGP